MNRKLFALVLLLPVAVFATDRLISKETPDGGGKEQKKTTAQTTHSQATTPVAETQVQVQESAPVVETEARTEIQAAQAPELDDRILKEIKASLEDNLEEAYQTQQENASVVGLGEEAVSENLSKWLDKAVYQPLTEANPVQIDFRRSFSRCASGYDVILTTTIAGALDNGGWLIANRGCSQRHIGRFEYNYAARTVQVHVGTTDQLLPLNQYLRYCKAALA